MQLDSKYVTQALETLSWLTREATEPGIRLDAAKAILNFASDSGGDVVPGAEGSEAQ